MYLNVYKDIIKFNVSYFSKFPFYFFVIYLWIRFENKITFSPSFIYGFFFFLWNSLFWHPQLTFLFLVHMIHWGILRNTKA